MTKAEEPEWHAAIDVVPDQVKKMTNEPPKIDQVLELFFCQVSLIDKEIEIAPGGVHPDGWDEVPHQRYIAIAQPGLGIRGVGSLLAQLARTSPK